MGIRNSVDDKMVFLYDSTSSRPLNMEGFDDEFKAESFLEWFLNRFDMSNIHDVALVEQARADWAEECLDDEGNLVE